MTNEEKRYLYNLKQVLERAKNYSALSAIEELEKENKTLTKENDILVKDLGCETCTITDEYKELNAKIRELEEELAEQKAHCKAVDEVNVKLRCCGNCMNRGLNKDDISYPCCDCKHWRKNKSND